VVVNTQSSDLDRTHLANPLLHLGLAVTIAKEQWEKYPNRYCTYEDYVQTAYVGLLDACKRYDSSIGTFSSFAYPTILGHIRRMRASRRIVRFGGERVNLAIARGLKSGGMTYTPDFAAERMSNIPHAPELKSEEEVHRAVGFVRGKDISIDDIHTSGNLLPEDILPDDTYPENIPYDSMVGRNWTRVLEIYREKVEQEGGRLKRLVLGKRLFVLDPEDQSTLADIGREVGVSRERVRQVEAVMLREIRQLVKELR